MRALFRRLRRHKFRYTPLVEIFISRERLLHNLRALQKASLPARVVPVLKSNAYGHGLIPIAQILDLQKLPFLVVDSYYEAMVLRNEGIRTPLLIIGYTAPENITSSRLHNVHYAVTSIDGLRQLMREVHRTVRIHLKIDTGMHRQGILPEECDVAISLLRAHPHIILEGICSHLADADTPHSAWTIEQIHRWNGIVARFQRAFPGLRYTHLSATAGISQVKNIQATVVRAGLGLYGISPSSELQLDLQPVLRMQSMVTSCQSLTSGDRVGYNGTFTATEQRRVATIPLGYYEGIDRRLSNTGVVTIDGVACPIIGRVSMNITTIDVSNVPAVKIGMPVTVVSAETADPNSIQSHAANSSALSYELLVHIPPTIRRTVV